MEEKKAHNGLLTGAQTVSLKKGETVLQPGGRATLAYYTTEGCLRSYVIDSNGKEHTLQFAPEGWFLSDIESFFNGTESKMYIEAVEATTAFCIAKNHMPAFEDMPHDQLLVINEKVRNSLIASNRRLIGLLSTSALDRYNEFIRIYPGLIQRLPQKLIASYIGVTPEYLSELRRKRVEK